MRRHQPMGDVGSEGSTITGRLRLSCPVPGGELRLLPGSLDFFLLLDRLRGADGPSLDRVLCRVASLCRVVTIVTAARARVLRCWPPGGQLGRLNRAQEGDRAVLTSPAPCVVKSSCSKVRHKQKDLFPLDLLNHVWLLSI